MKRVVSSKAYDNVGQYTFQFDIGKNYDKDVVDNAITDIISEIGGDVGSVTFSTVIGPRQRRYNVKIY